MYKEELRVKFTKELKELGLSDAQIDRRWNLLMEAAVEELKKIEGKKK